MIGKKLVSYGKMMRLPLLLIASFVFAMFQGGFVSWFLFYSFLPFVLYPVLLFFYPLNKFQVSRVLNQRQYKAGNAIHVEVTIRRSNRFPLLFLIIEDTLPPGFMKQNEQSNRFAFWLFQKKFTYTYTIPMAVRGEHHFHTIKLITGDWLGFYTKKHEYDCTDTILVYPKLKHLSYEQMDSLFEQGIHSSIIKKQEVTSIVTGVRNYIPGDRMTAIHWKATARKNEMMTKEFEVHKSQNICVILDQSPSLLFEELVTFATSLLDAALWKGAGISFSGSHTSSEGTTIGKGEDGRQKIFYKLAKIKEVEESTPLLAVGARTYGDTVYMMITSQLNEQVLSSLSMLKGSGTVTLVLMTDSISDTVQEKLVGEAEKRGIPCRVLASGSWTRFSKEGMT